MKAKIMFLLSSVVFFSDISHAETDIYIGKVLNSEEISKLDGPIIKLDEQSLKIIDQKDSTNKMLRTSVGGEQPTYVINDRGVIGKSQNLVLISEISPVEVHATAKKILNSAVSVKYYDHLNVSYIRFKNFNQALLAREKLIRLFPNANITVPIKFSESSVR